MKLSRERIDDFEWLSNPNMFYVFFRLLLMANYKDKKWEGIDIMRGQLVTGRKVLSEQLHLSEQQIRTCLDKLTKSHYINQQTTNRYTIITICDYDSWISSQQADNQQITNQQPTDNQQITTTKINEINSNIQKEEDTNVSEKKSEKPKKEKDELFEECWAAYGKKGIKHKALDYWKKLTDDEKASVLPHIKSYVSSRDRQYQKDFERYVRDKVFKTVIVKGNQTVYDPDMFENKEEYHPVVDNISHWWDEKRKCLIFNGYTSMIHDGYTDENRPDGAKAAHNMYEWIWSKSRKEWVQQ